VRQHLKSDVSADGDIVSTLTFYPRFIGSLDRNSARRGIIIYSEKMSSVAKKVSDVTEVAANHLGVKPISISRRDGSALDER
jgi:hypothetical protein